MTHDEAKALKLPAVGWTTGFTPGDIWLPLPLPLKVLEYGTYGDASIPTLLCRDAFGLFRTCVDLIFLTKADAEADIVKGLQGSYQAEAAAIASSTAEMAKIRQHPLWKDPA